MGHCKKLGLSCLYKQAQAKDAYRHLNWALHTKHTLAMDMLSNLFAVQKLWWRRRNYRASPCPLPNVECRKEELLWDCESRRTQTTSPNELRGLNRHGNIIGLIVKRPYGTTRPCRKKKKPSFFWSRSCECELIQYFSEEHLWYIRNYIIRCYSIDIYGLVQKPPPLYNVIIKYVSQKLTQHYFSSGQKAVVTQRANHAMRENLLIGIILRTIAPEEQILGRV